HLHSRLFPYTTLFRSMLIAIKDRKDFGHGMTSGEVWVRHRANEHPMPDSRTYSADESAAAEVMLHCQPQVACFSANEAAWASHLDRKSTRLNSSHVKI